MQTQGRLMVGPGPLPAGGKVIAFMDTHPNGGPGGAVLLFEQTGCEAVYAAGVLRSLPPDWRTRAEWEPA